MPIAIRHVGDVAMPESAFTISLLFKPELDDKGMNFQFVLRHKSPYRCLNVVKVLVELDRDNAMASTDVCNHPRSHSNSGPSAPSSLVCLCRRLLAEKLSGGKFF